MRAACAYPVTVRLPSALLALAAALALAAPAAAQVPDDLSADRLDRAALLSLPSIYRIDVQIRVGGLLDATGRRIPLPQRPLVVEESGTAFGVAGGGWLATARHVADPEAESVGRLALQRKLVAEDRPHGEGDVERALGEGVRAISFRVTRRTVRPADLGPASGAPPRLPARDVVSSPDADLALVRIDAPGAPVLALEYSATGGTPVMTIGFGRASAFGDPGRGAFEPAIRRGRLVRTANLARSRPPRDVILTSVPVESGDSGAPVVDDRGRVRGVAVFRAREGTIGSIAEQPAAVRALLQRAGLEDGANDTAETFRTAMGALWALDLDTARTGFRDTLSEYPRHALAAREEERVEELQAADFELEGGSRRRSLLLGVGAVAAVVAMGFGLALVRSARAGRPPVRRRSDALPPADEH